tara:strand:- start:4815 stop:5060 length:246 start_codon:yes stop_codon:yes gene_type:complete
MAGPWAKGGWENFHVIDTKGDISQFKLGHPDMKPKNTIRKLMNELRRLFPWEEFRVEKTSRSTIKWIESRPKDKKYRRKDY